MGRTQFETLDVYLLAEKLSDGIWTMVCRWQPLARDTVGKQMIRAADSIGANIAEGVGRGSYQDNRRFVRVARGSLNETKTLAAPGLQPQASRRGGRGEAQAALG